MNSQIAIDLYTFADASELGFGSITYLHFIFENSFDLAFVMVKSRVAPLKFISIHRLEL